MEIDLKDVIKKENILKLEKQIEELDKQYNIDFEKSMNNKLHFGLGLKYTMDIVKEYTTKKIEFEVKLAMLKEKK